MTQIQKVYDAFHDTPKTMLDVAREVNVYRANVCRYLRVMKRQGTIQKIYKGRDRRTKNWAWYYSTDEKFWKKQDTQLSLFGEEARHEI